MTGFMMASLRMERFMDKQDTLTKKVTFLIKNLKMVLVKKIIENLFIVFQNFKTK